MNFKECYKKANDEIKGDRALLENILNTPQKEKAKIIPIVYKAASVAAAFVLIVTIALMPGIKEKFIVDEEVHAETETEEVTAEESIELAYDTAEAEKGAAVFSVRTVEGERAAENAKEKAEPAEASVVPEVAVINETDSDIVAYSAEYDETEVAVASEEAYDGDVNDIALTSEAEAPVVAEEAPKTEIAASGGGGGAPAVMKSAKPKKSSYTARDVLAHIGIDYESLTLEGMALTENSILAEFAEDGTISYYYIDITLSDGDKHMSIILTDSATPLAYDVSEAEGGVIVSKTYKSTDVFITAQNMTKDEVENYINSIS